MEDRVSGKQMNLNCDREMERQCDRQMDKQIDKQRQTDGNQTKNDISIRMAYLQTDRLIDPCNDRLKIIRIERQTDR